MTAIKVHGAKNTLNKVWDGLLLSTPYQIKTNNIASLTCCLIREMAEDWQTNKYTLKILNGNI